MTQSESLAEEIKKVRSQSEYHRAYYLANKERIKKQATQFQLDNPDKVKVYLHRNYLKKKWSYIPLEYHSCIVCGTKDKDMLSFHHVNPKKKVFTIAKYIYEKKSKVKLGFLLPELYKTVVLCTECHTALHSTTDLSFLDPFIEDWLNLNPKFKVIR